jgi:hypothetical protein
VVLTLRLVLSPPSGRLEPALPGFWLT